MIIGNSMKEDNLTFKLDQVFQLAVLKISV